MFKAHTRWCKFRRKQSVFVTAEADAGVSARARRQGIGCKVHFVYPNPGTGKDRWAFDAPQFLIVNIAVGGGFGGAVDDSIFPARMEIDHVRVYQESAPRSAGSTVLRGDLSSPAKPDLLKSKLQAQAQAQAQPASRP